MATIHELVERKRAKDAARLAQELRDAEAAHKKAVEAGTATDADWADWYADFIINGRII